MRKSCATLALASLLAAADASAEFATTGTDPFAKGETVVFAAVSAGHYGGYGSTLLPPITLGLDYAFHEYITAGGSFSFSHYDYRSASLSYLTFVARGTFHPVFWFKNIRIPLDPYGIASLGYSMALWDGPGNASDYHEIVIGPGVGARYWFTPRFSFQAEAGVGLGVNLASVGIACKL